jgi:hypothetical protein
MIRTPRIIAHPVMGWYVITLLALWASLPLLYVLVAPVVAQIVSLFGTVLVVGGFAIYAVIDSTRRHRR